MNALIIYDCWQERPSSVGGSQCQWLYGCSDIQVISHKVHNMTYIYPKSVSTRKQKNDVCI